MKMLTANERAIYNFFLQKFREDDGFVEESHREIAIILGCSAGGVSGGIRSLVKKGFISVKVRQGLAGMEISILKEVKSD